MKIPEKIKKNKKKIIIIAIILILIIIGKVKSNKAQDITNEPEIEAIQKRTIAQSVSATGNIKTENSQNITSMLTGSTIASVNVVEGQNVNIGDTICTFDMATIKDNLSDAKTTASISNSQANLGIEAARRNLNDAISARDSQIVTAQEQVAAAEKNYNDAQTEISNLKSVLATKQAELSSIAVQPVITENTIETQNTITETNLVNPAEVLEQEITKLQISINELEVNIPILKETYETAVANLNNISSSLDSTVASMQDNLTNAELAAQSSSIAQNSQLKTYQEQLEKGIVTSTISGTVTSVGVKKGDIYTGGSIATVNGCDEFIVEAEIDEYDIADIKTGMKVLIKTDATREKELEGTVSYVSISPTISSSLTATPSSNVTYTIKITLNEQNERLRLGMNAKISIIINQKENVWSVPYEAIYEREDGTHYVEIVKDENTMETEELDVEIGIEGTYYTEIISSSLEDGMKVLLPERDTSNSIEELISSMGADAGI